MAFFKFRKASDDSASVPVQPPSVESIRQRARYRLAGATLLVLLGVVGFPLLFDKQPRPIAVDTPISIPDKNKVLPLVIPAEPASAPGATPTEAGAAVATDKAVASAVAAPETAVITEAAEPPKPEVRASSGPVKNHVTTPVPVPVVVPPGVKEPSKSGKPAAIAAKLAEAARVQSLLDGQSVAAKAVEVKTADAPAATGSGRFVVQVGAFADNAHAREVRLKLERAGLKTYTQVADTKDGKRIRVRVGPLATKAEADKVAEKIKKLSLSAAVLTL